MPSTPTLSAKQTRFVSEYLVDGNAAQAAIRAGYKPIGAKVTGCRLLTNPNLRARLEALQAADATRLCLEREVVLNGLTQSIEMARLQGNPAAMIRGWSEIGRLMGYYAPEVKKVDLDVGCQVEIDRVNQLSDAELVRIIETGTASETNAAARVR